LLDFIWKQNEIITLLERQSCELVENPALALHAVGVKKLFILQNRRSISGLPFIFKINQNLTFKINGVQAS